MNRRLSLTASCFIVMSSFFAGQCLSQEPAEPQSTEELRREVVELRATVAELSKRLETLEYQKMPRADIRSPQLAEPRDPAPSYVWPTGQPARFPVEVHQLPTTTPTTNRTLPANLRFSEEVERAMMGPF